MTLGKRLFDFLFALCLLPFLVPLLLFVLLLVALFQGRPWFYGAERMRSPESGFRLWKFRTMTSVQSDFGVSGADKAVRITPLGRLLRRSRLDELPQIWNILRGDMTFVGPRPPLRIYVERFPGLYAEVLNMRPGVTGLASLHYHRHEEKLLARCATAAETDRVYTARCIPAKARLDLIYARHRSLCFDLAIILGTVWRILRRS